MNRVNDEDSFMHNYLKQITIILLFSNLFLTGCNFQKNDTVKGETHDNTKTSVTISAVGDVMIHDSQLQAQYNEISDDYSFHNNFLYIKPYIKSTDLSFVNLETTLSGEPYTAYPFFNSPDSIITALKDTGFNVISTVNNHTADTGTDGIIRTIDVIKQHDLDYVGTKQTEKQKDYLIKEVNGIKLGIISYSYGEIDDGRKYLNGVPVPQELTDYINIFDPSDLETSFEEIKVKLNALKKENVDSIIFLVHWGDEYMRQPNTTQIELAQLLCDEGVQIILGSHPHVVQPMDILTSSDGINETFVAYSMGNILSNQREEILQQSYTEDGVIPFIEIEKDMLTNTTSIKKIQYLPTWVYKYQDAENERFVYEILPLLNDKNLFSKIHLTDNLVTRLEKSYNDTTQMVQNDKITPFEPDL